MSHAGPDPAWLPSKSNNATVGCWPCSSQDNGVRLHVLCVGRIAGIVLLLHHHRTLHGRPKGLSGVHVEVFSLRLRTGQLR
jgi:hypothetical protein